MLNSADRRFILPFSLEKKNESFSSEVETAAVFALSELERVKGGGLILRQPEETIYFIAKMGYPIWLYPNNFVAFMFDGLGNFNYSVPYFELPDAKSFIENLDESSKTKEDYLTFLSANRSYFLNPKKERLFQLRSLIVDSEFKKEFDIYSKEAIEVIEQPPTIVPLTPSLKETTISSLMTEMNTLQSSLKENADMLLECLRRLSKTTSQYQTELDYASEAVKDETEAKIKAQEEILKPQIAKLNREHKHKITNLTTGFCSEISKLEKLKAKTSKQIRAKEKKLTQFEQSAKKQAQKKHLIYEKRWKTKARITKKELSGLNKELKRIENTVEHLTKQKNEQVSSLRIEFENEIKLTRQPLLDLETARDSKMLIFKQETEKLVNQEKPLVEDLNGVVKLVDQVSGDFQMLGTRNQELKESALFYVPFYLTCYQVGPIRRYFLISPSMISNVGLTAKLKGVIGISKIKEMFTPRFKTIASLIDKVQVLTKQDIILDQQIINLGEKNNLLKNEVIRVNITNGLVYLKDSGWISQREYQSLITSLSQS
jgi:hypothetical protein